MVNPLLLSKRFPSWLGAIFFFFIDHRSITFTINTNGSCNASFISEEGRTDDAAKHFIGMHLMLVYLVWISIVSNPTILFIYIQK